MILPVLIGASAGLLLGWWARRPGAAPRCFCGNRAQWSNEDREFLCERHFTLRKYLRAGWITHEQAEKASLKLVR